MKIFYHLSSYISFRLTGSAYIQCLRNMGHTVLTSPEEAPQADIAIIHENVSHLPRIFADIPALGGMRTIAYAVWENEILPPMYISSLRLVDEIWTPSTFSQQSMLPHFASVSVVPHIVQRQRTCAEDYAFARGVVAGLGRFTFFSIIDSINPRKNLPALLRVFTRFRGQYGDKAQLVLKQYRQAFSLEKIPGLISLDENLSSGKIAALHIASDAYLSAHCQEGWGLGLSEAMSYGKPVIATGYSGNMQFMNPTNSFPISYSLEPIPEAMLENSSAYVPGMHWAAVDEDAMLAAMQQVFARRYPAVLAINAAAINKQFSSKAVGEIIKTLLGK